MGAPSETSPIAPGASGQLGTCAGTQPGKSKGRINVGRKYLAQTHGRISQLFQKHPGYHLEGRWISSLNYISCNFPAHLRWVTSTILSFCPEKIHISHITQPPRSLMHNFFHQKVPPCLQEIASLPQLLLVCRRSFRGMEVMQDGIYAGKRMDGAKAKLILH